MYSKKKKNATEQEEIASILKSTYFFLKLHNPSINKNEVIVKAIIDLGLNGTVLFHCPLGKYFRMLPTMVYFMF